MANSGPDDELLDRIRGKRSELERFLSSARPRKRRLLNTTIIAGSVAAALTAAPALGGPSLTTALTEVLGLGMPSWRLLCGAAAASSLMATISTQLLKSHNVEEHVVRAQGGRAKLEVLEISLATSQIDVRQATSEYLKCVEETAFLETS
jgi:hypothetical protein